MKPGDKVTIKRNTQKLREKFLQSTTNILDVTPCLGKVLEIESREGYHNSCQMFRLKKGADVILKESGGKTLNVNTDIHQYLIPAVALKVVCSGERLKNFYY